jgi:hypothetical protein
MYYMESEIIWHKSLSKALELARKDNKLVLINFFGAT